MSSEGVNYITPCGHERHRNRSSKHPPRPSCRKDGARGDEDAGRADERGDGAMASWAAGADKDETDEARRDGQANGHI